MNMTAAHLDLIDRVSRISRLLEKIAEPDDMIVEAIALLQEPDWTYDDVMAAPDKAPEDVRRELADNCLGWAKDALNNGDIDNAASFARDADMLLDGAHNAPF